MEYTAFDTQISDVGGDYSGTAKAILNRFSRYATLDVGKARVVSVVAYV